MPMMGALQERGPEKGTGSPIVHLDDVRAQRGEEAARAAMQPTIDEITAMAIRWNDEISGGLFAKNGQRIRAYPEVVNRHVIPGVTLPTPTPDYPRTWMYLQTRLEEQLVDRAPVGSPGYNNFVTREGVLEKLGLSRGRIAPDLSLGFDEQDSSWYILEAGDYPHVYLVTHIKPVEEGVELSEKMIVSQSRDDLSHTVASHFAHRVTTVPHTPTID